MVNYITLKITTRFKNYPVQLFCGTFLLKFMHKFSQIYIKNKMTDRKK